MCKDELAAHRRMQACLRGIQHLDPERVGERLRESEAEIARLEALLAEGGERKRQAQRSATLPPYAFISVRAA